MHVSESTVYRTISRRRVAAGVAWAAPAVAAAAAAPALAGSVPTPTEPPVLSSQLWFSGRGVADSYTSTCSVPDMRGTQGACGAPTSDYPWRTRFQMYGTDDVITSDQGSCTRESWISVTNLTAEQLTGPITLTFWRPEHPEWDDNIRDWYPGRNDSGAWSGPVRTSTPPVQPFSGTFAAYRMYEYQTTLSLEEARMFMLSDGQGGITLDMSAAGAAMSFYSDCFADSYQITQAFLDAYGRLGRYVLTVPTTEGDLVKDTGFYTS